MSGAPVETRWAEEELRVLRNIFPVAGAGRVATMLGRTFAAVTTQAQKQGLAGNRRGKRPDGNAMTDRLVTRLAHAKACGMTIHELRASEPEAHPQTVVTTLGRMVAAGRIFAAGARVHRRYFATSEQAQAWKLFGMPVTQKRKRPAKRAAIVISGGMTLHPNFKFTRVPPPPAPLRTNTYPIF